MNLTLIQINNKIYLYKAEKMYDQSHIIKSQPLKCNLIICWVQWNFKESCLPYTAFHMWELLIERKKKVTNRFDKKLVWYIN